MKNKYLEEQIVHMLNEVEEFRHNCQMAARADDGRVGFFEKHDLKKLENACDWFERELKIMMK